MFLQLDAQAKETLKAMQGEVRAVKEAIGSQVLVPPRFFTTPFEAT